MSPGWTTVRRSNIGGFARGQGMRGGFHAGGPGRGAQSFRDAVREGIRMNSPRRNPFPNAMMNSSAQCVFLHTLLTIT